MKNPRRRFLQQAAGAAVLTAVSQITWAEAFPARPIWLAVPLPPGGAFYGIGGPWADRAVSYTHLDVYKRQLQGHLSAFRQTVRADPSIMMLSLSSLFPAPNLIRHPRKHRRAFPWHFRFTEIVFDCMRASSHIWSGGRKNRPIPGPTERLTSGEARTNDRRAPPDGCLLYTSRCV